jgi:hypothetical protein
LYSPRWRFCGRTSACLRNGASSSSRSQSEIGKSPRVLSKACRRTGDEVWRRVGCVKPLQTAAALWNVACVSGLVLCLVTPHSCSCVRRSGALCAGLC